MKNRGAPAARSAGKATARRNPNRRSPRVPSPDAPPLDDPQLYVNRELGLLEFQRRVLEEAQDETVPLLERVKFLSIVGSNLDEFFMVRVAGLAAQVDAGTMEVGADGIVRQPGKQNYAGSSLAPLEGVRRAAAMLGAASSKKRRALGARPVARSTCS